MLTNFNIIILLILIPFLSAFLIFFLNNTNNKLIRTISIYCTSITFYISIFLLIIFDKSIIGFQCLCEFSWLKFLNINLMLGIDGISLIFILLTTFLFLICILSSWNYINFNLKLFYINFLLMESILILIFSCLDIIFFYIFFESILIPMFLILGFFGSRERKIKASFMFFIYTFIGSILLLLGILLIYYYTGTTNYIILNFFKFNNNIQKLLWIFFFIGFAVKVPLIPFHSWLPEAHVEAPTPGSVILAGLLLKLGTYGFLRFNISLFNYANIIYSPFVYTLSCFGLIYASFIAIKQTDIKRIIAYSSIAHMNLIMIGLFSCQLNGLQGALIQMVSHGLVSGGLFLIVGILYERCHTRLIKYYGGLVITMPIFSFFFLIFTLCNIAFPLSSSYIGEFLIFLSIFKNNLILAIFTISSMILSSIYSLWLYNRLIFGNYKINFLKYYIEDLNKRECFMLISLIIIILFIGIHPTYISSYLNSSLNYLLYNINI